MNVCGKARVVKTPNPRSFLILFSRLPTLRHRAPHQRRFMAAQARQAQEKKGVFIRVTFMFESRLSSRPAALRAGFLREVSVAGCEPIFGLMRLRPRSLSRDLRDTGLLHLHASGYLPPLRVSLCPSRYGRPLHACCLGWCQRHPRASSGLGWVKLGVKEWLGTAT